MGLKLDFVTSKCTLSLNTEIGILAHLKSVVLEWSKGRNS